MSFSAIVLKFLGFLSACFLADHSNPGILEPSMITPVQLDTAHLFSQINTR